MLVFLENQAVSLVRPFNVCFQKYALKGTGNVLLHSCFFLVSTYLEDSVWSGWGSVFLVCFLGLLFPQSYQRLCKQ